MDDHSGRRAILSRLGLDAQDVLDELLSRALAFEHTHIPDLQGFYKWQTEDQTEIIRSASDHIQQVRIMTVHASKGLEAPIVILPDTIRSKKRSANNRESKIFFPDKSSLSMPIYIGRKEYQFPQSLKLQADAEERAEQEYKRLLYVAMTRAQDRLYVYGAVREKSHSDKSWYYFMQKGFEGYAAQHTHTEIAEPVQQKSVSDEVKSSPAVALQPIEMPIILKQQVIHTEHDFSQHIPAAQDNYTHKIDTYTQASGQENSRGLAVRRGIIVHRMLELLANRPDSQRDKLAQHFLQTFATDIPSALQQDIHERVLRVLRMDQTRDYFGNNGRSEVAISGSLNGRKIVGQIDRLVLTPSEILVLDYKTGPVPANHQAIPAQYLRQMYHYVSLLESLYPQHRVRAGLLWTRGPEFMALPPEILNKAVQ
jgi:ATP-dependent helicase/nuclease subunit A